MFEQKELLTIKEASEWASQHLSKNVTSSNISYLIQYAKVKKHESSNGATLIAKNELLKYYDSFYGKRELSWKEKLGSDLNWELSFDYLKESDTTKHVHRLHPYKGKFIPQLVEYFLDEHTDNFKKDVFFKKGEVVLDPFCGSGTTLVQANELGINAIGIDISAFNTLISNCKIDKYDFFDLHNELKLITKELKKYLVDSKIIDFENELATKLSEFNKEFFPSPDFKFRVKNKEIDLKSYSTSKEKEFLQTYNLLVKEFGIELRQNKNENFLDNWFLQSVRKEIDFVFGLVKKIKNTQTKKIVSVILSRTVRSCRATTHADLATLRSSITSTYFCRKHGKICKPIFSILGWWNRYSQDTLKRLTTFNNLRTDSSQLCLTGDSREIDIFGSLENKNPEFASLVREQKISGIFSSPPYIGLIDYHEQHSYAYDLFGFQRRDESEIGPLFRGQGKEARDSYVEGISSVLKNSKRFLKKDYNIFLVSNDKYNLYPKIAELSGMQIVDEFKRPVLNRTEKDKSAYSEIIFHLKEK